MRFSPNTTTLLMLHAPHLRMKLLSPTVVPPIPVHIVWIPVSRPLRRNKSGFVWEQQQQQPTPSNDNEGFFTMDVDNSLLI